MSEKGKGNLDVNKLAKSFYFAISSLVALLLALWSVLTILGFFGAFSHSDTLDSQIVRQIIFCSSIACYSWALVCYWAGMYVFSKPTAKPWSTNYVAFIASMSYAIYFAVQLTLGAFYHLWLSCDCLLFIGIWYFPILMVANLWLLVRHLKPREDDHE